MIVQVKALAVYLKDELCLHRGSCFVPKEYEDAAVEHAQKFPDDMELVTKAKPVKVEKKEEVVEVKKEEPVSKPKKKAKK